MALVLNPSSPAGEEIRRVAVERLDQAIGRLGGLDQATPNDIEEAIHGARKNCKEVRALARLVRSQVGSDFATFNDLVGEAADELAPMRDAHAVLGTLDDLRAARRDNDKKLRVVRTVQADRAEQATRSVRSGDPRIDRSKRKLLAARELVGQWKVPDDNRWLATGIGTSYAKGRSDMRRARKQPADDRMHQWRKNVKRLWYQVRLIEAAAPSILSPLCSQLDDLAEALGDDHDLAVLIERLKAKPSQYGGRRNAKRAVKVARAQQKDLRKRAFRLGATLYTESTDAFVRRVTAYWETTQSLGPELPTGGIAELVADERHDPAGPAPHQPDHSIERERKFIVERHPDPPAGGTVFRQGYLAIDGRVSLRVRDGGAQGCTLTAKAGGGAVRTEFEWPISAEQFELAWQHTEGRRVHKTRYRFGLETGETAEIDVFHDELDGLIVAEVEFDSDERLAAFHAPEWFGQEVTDDEHYTNAVLAVRGAP